MKDLQMPYLNSSNGEVWFPTSIRVQFRIRWIQVANGQNSCCLMLWEMIGTALVAQQHSKRLDSWFAIDEQSWTVGVFDGFELQLMQTALD